jgi:hypothetical protein
VLLEKKEGIQYVTHGTGFILADKKENNRAVIVTCKHLLKNPEIYVVLPYEETFQKLLAENKIVGNKFNVDGHMWQIEKGILRNKTNLIKDSTFVTDSILDLAAFPIRIPTTFSIDESNNPETFANVSAISIDRIKLRKEVKLAEELLIIGYALGIGSLSGLITQENSYYSSDLPIPVARSGIVAWFTDSQNEFLVDVLSFGGNSGCPVMSRIDSKLIGMIYGHWDDVYKRNIGLARCVWSDDILSIFHRALLLEDR